MIRTVSGAAKERELDHVRGAHTGHELLDVLEAGLLELGTLGRIRRILYEGVVEERLANHVAPVAGRLGEDRAQLGCDVRINFLIPVRVDVREANRSARVG